MYPMGAAEPRRGIICKTTGVEAAVEAGTLLERSMAREFPSGRKREGDITEGGSNGDTLNAEEGVEGGKHFFFRI
jgi:hypothetical protein